MSSAIFDFSGKGAKLKSAVYVLLLVTLLVLPLSVEIPIIKTTRWNFPLELLVPLLAAAAAVGMILLRNELRFTFSDAAAVLFLAGAGISAVFSRIPVYSFKALVVLSSYAVALYFGLRLLNLTQLQWRLVWRVMAVSFGILMIYTLVRYSQLGIHRQHSYEMSLPFVPGHTLLIAIGFPAFLFSLNELLRKIDLKFNVPFVTLFVFTVAVSYSRIYWVLLVLFSFTLVFYYFKTLRLPMLLAAGFLIPAGGIIYHRIDEKRNREGAWNDPDDHNSLFVQFQSIFVWHKNESNIERSNRWKVAKEIFRLHPLTGSGLNTYPEVYFWYKDRAAIEETNLSCSRMNAHQLYIGWLSEMGVIGFAGGIILLLAFFLNVINLRGSPHFVYALLLFLNFVLLGLIEDFTTLEKIMGVFWVATGFGHYLSRNPDDCR